MRIEESFEPSPLQEGMLYHALGEGQPGVDVEHVSCLLAEEIDPETLERSWRWVVARHPILRTCFRFQDDGRPVQDVYDEVTLPFERKDWRDAPPPSQDGMWRVLLAEDRRGGFDLLRPPLMRLVLVTLGDRRHRLLWSFHHAILDGRAFPLVLTEVFDHYDAERSGRPLEASPPPRPYRDFVRWLKDEAPGPAETFWRRMLDGVDAPTSLGLPRPETPRASDDLSTGAESSRLPPGATERLRAFARDHELTLGTIVHGAWALVLHHYSSEDDIVFGSTVTLRRGGPDGAEDMVGLLINTLPLRTRVDPSAPVEKWLQSLRRQQLATRDYASTSLVRIQALSDVAPGTSLFDSIVVYDHAGLDASLRARRPLWTTRRFEYRGQTNFPVTLLAYGEDALHLQLEHERRILDEGSAERLLAHLSLLLEEIPDAAGRPLGALPRLTDSEREQVLVEWNETRRDYPLDQTLHQLIAEQVQRSPERVAVESEDGQLTYRELGHRASQLAHRLRHLGVGPGERVGVAMERSPEMVVALLGTLGAGGAYVPVDPSYPEDRVAFMLADARVPVLLTHERLRASLPTGDAEVLALDSEWDVPGEVSPAGPEVTSLDLAYVIYTSGSTGQPKGAMNAHRGIVNRLLWMQEVFALGPDDAILQKTPFSFDVSVWEFFWPLLTGARLVMARPEGHKDPGYLVRTIQEKSITTVHFVPTMLQAFLEEPGVEECQSLRRVICSGEALSSELRNRFFGRLGCELHNLYGPTEAAVDVTHWPCGSDDAGTVVPIGRPVANTQTYVLDRRLQPQPVGVPGELYIGGVQVGQGYLGRPELTAERFVPDPFSGGAGARLYRTGDRVRLRRDGSLEFLGRLDHQVKVRGFRVELGEIESALLDHPAVREAVVVARQDRDADPRLVGYYVGQAGAHLENEIRSALRTRLPEYMVPSALVPLEAIPLLGNGKVNRRALPAPERDRRRDDSQHVAPANPMEETVGRIWAGVLGTSRVSVEESFFDLGGNSILLLQVVARARREGVEIAPLTMFRHPTVRSLAAHLSGGGAPPALSGVRDRARRQREVVKRRKKALRRG